MKAKTLKDKLKRVKEAFQAQDRLIEQDYITGLDYSNILLDAYCKTMEPLDVLKNPTVNKAYQSAAESMSHLYQVIGQELYKNEEKTNRKSKKRS